ncbi:MAG: GNAT family N-acetyltransferase [Microgenomates group bacterium]|nr:GNAT family N-acetyltransferase [Microgenomates group bacterium]
MKFNIKSIDDKERKGIKKIIKERWNDKRIVYNGKVFYPHKLKGFIALKGKEIIGLISYKTLKNTYWIISIDFLFESRGIGTALIKTVKKEAKKNGIKKLKLITTNDNLSAIRFYQKRGFRLKKIYPNAVEKSRKVKPTIPKVGEEGIPILDEIELEMIVN